MQVLAAFECGVVPNNWLVVRWEKLLNELITVSVTESLCITTSHFVSKCFGQMVLLLISRNPENTGQLKHF